MTVLPSRERSGVLARLDSEGASLRPAFTPIADLRRASIAGYEVALGFPDEASLTPRAWSLPADPPDMAGEIEARVLAIALKQRLLLPPGPTLHVTLSHRALLSAAVVDVLAVAGRLDDLVLVTDAPERIDELTALERAMTQARRAGAVLAVESSGGGYETLQMVSRVRAEYVRVERSLIEGLAGDDAKAATLESLVRLGARAGTYVVAEGASQAEDLATAMTLGVTFAMGPIFGPAAPEPGPLAPQGLTAIRAGAREGLRHSDLHGLIEHFPALPADATLEELADAFLQDPRNAYLVLIDGDFTPVSLVERTALLHAEPYERPVVTVSPSTPVGVAARRAVERATADRFLPLVCCDAQGKYVGLVSVDGLLDALAARD